MQIDALMYKIVPRHALGRSLWWIVTLKGFGISPGTRHITGDTLCSSRASFVSMGEMSGSYTMHTMHDWFHWLGAMDMMF